MVKVELVFVCSDELGEAEAVFRDGKLISSWSCNDATWRGEYFNGFLKELGVEVVTRQKPTKDMIQQIKDSFGV